MRDETRRGKESVLPQGYSSEQLIGDTYRCAALCFHILFYEELTGNCAAVIQDQDERERDEGKVLNCCNKLQISHRLSINVIKAQSTCTNTQLTVKAKHLYCFTF